MPNEQINRSIFVHAPSKDLIGVGPDAGVVETVRPYNGEMLKEDERLVTENSFHISWVKFGWAQASVHFDMEAMCRYVDEYRARKAKGSTDDGLTEFGSVHADFTDRTELTKLIEIAKRARTQTFGA